jgi:hypothetical protein
MDPDPARNRRTYFNHPLVTESLQTLPAALQHPTAAAFRDYVVEHVPQNSLKGRKRIARDLVQRFSEGGQMNLSLAAAISRFGESRIAREILCFELLRAMPLLQEIATLWLAQLPEEGAPRSSLMTFLAPRLPGRSIEKVTKDSLTTFKQCGKLRSHRLAWFQPVWSPPPIEAFLYVLARLCPEHTMVRVELFSVLPILRGLLWPQSSIEDLLRQAKAAGHVTKISRLDQYHQFTLAGSGHERLRLLLPEQMAAADRATQFELRPPEGD